METKVETNAEKETKMETKLLKSVSMFVQLAETTPPRDTITSLIVVQPSRGSASQSHQPQKP